MVARCRRMSRLGFFFRVRVGFGAGSVRMVVLNAMAVPLELHWAYAADASDLASHQALHDTTLVADVAAKSFVRITAQPGQLFLGVLKGPGA